MHYQGKFTLTPDHGVAGTTVTATGTGLTAGSKLSISWNTVKGHWLLQGEYSENYLGRGFDPVVSQVATATVDATGAFSAGFVVPQGYGFSHDVTVQDGTALVNKAAFSVTPEVSIAQASGPVGTPIQLTMKSEGWADLQNSWAVTYDDHYAGWLSSVTTNGLARPPSPRPAVRAFTSSRSSTRRSPCRTSTWSNRRSRIGPSGRSSSP